jgi:acyl-CoA hydrolase
MLSDSAIPLIESGVLNGSRKTIHRGKIILSFVLGSKKLFDYVNNNPMFEFHPNKYTNDPWVVSQNSKMVAINSALQVDITGQVCADSIGTYFYSGIGGQVDFIRGASQSKGGKPIIAIPSTAKDGTISRVVPMLDPGAGVVTSRGAVHYVVTEFGVAYLHGRTIRQRAEALIQVAHPKFRDELYAYCEKTRWLQRPALQVCPEPGAITVFRRSESWQRKREARSPSIRTNARVAAFAWTHARRNVCFCCQS